MADWTPGPWTISEVSATTVVVMNDERKFGLLGSRTIALTGGYQTNMDSGEHVKENEANARVIAEIPEMVELLRYHLASLEASEGEFVGLREDTRALLARLNGN